MKQKPKPLLNKTKIILASIGIILLAVIIIILVVKPHPAPINNTTTSEVTHNLTSGMVIVSPGHPINEQEFNSYISGDV